MSTLVEELSNCYPYLVGLLRFPDLFGKAFSSNFQFLYLNFQPFCESIVKENKFLHNTEILK